MTDCKTRPLGGTECSWARAVPGGTGVTVLALLIYHPPDISLLQTALRTVQTHHPILRSKLNTDAPTPFFSIPDSPPLQIRTVDLPATSALVAAAAAAAAADSSPLHLLLEHELNLNTPWADPAPAETPDLFFATLYEIPDSKAVLVLRLHTSVCDRTAAVALMRELMVVMRKGEKSADWGADEVGLPLEEMIPKGKGDKPFWARGLDLVGYSLNSFRHSQLDFEDLSPSRRSEVVRLQMSEAETTRLLAKCKEKEIKLCGVLAAAGLIAVNSSKHLADNQRENYAVITLVDCRKILDPPLHDHSLGFYHSAILNTHDICKGQEAVWGVAKRCHTAFSNSKNSNKHFTDISDLNLLMVKAIENPGLTPSASLRTSLISVFEDPVIDDSGESLREVGLKDYIGCASAHGIGPSIAIFDTIRDGRLDCACVYPSPLHSRKQMQGLIDHMKQILTGTET